MAVNLVEMARKLVSEHLGEISSAVGASPEATRGAIDKAIPAVLSGLIKKVSSSGGADALVNEAGTMDSSWLGNIGEQLQGANLSNTMSRGKSLVESIFGPDLSRVLTSITEGTSLGSDSAMKLLSLLAPIVLGLLKSQGAGGWDAGSLKDLVLSQKDWLAGLVPAGLESVLGMGGASSNPATSPATRASSRASDAFDAETEKHLRPDRERSSAVAKVLPIVGVLLLALALWWFFLRAKDRENPEPFPETDDIELDINIPDDGAPTGDTRAGDAASGDRGTDTENMPIPAPAPADNP